MRRRLLLLLVLSAIIAAFPGAAFASTPNLGAATTSTAQAADTTGTVHAVLFWLDGCAHCKKVMTEVLPPLQEQYGKRLEIKQIEVSDAEGSVLFDRAAAKFGMKTSESGVPFLVIGDHALVGSVQIPLELPALVAQYAAAGGVAYPAITGLDQAIGSDTKSAASESGFTLAWAVMLLLVSSIIYLVIAVILRARGQLVPRGPSWLSLLVPVLCIAGLAVAIYLSYIETTATQAFCGPVGNCNAVQSSPYSKLFGILPIGVLGSLGYIAILLVWLWGRFRSDRAATYAPVAILTLAAFGVAFSIYLTYLELFVILAVCIWCLTSAVIMALLLWISVGPGLARPDDA